jgi:hypothetical protein
VADLIDKHHALLAQIKSFDAGDPLAQPTTFGRHDFAQRPRYDADPSVHISRYQSIRAPEVEVYIARIPESVYVCENETFGSFTAHIIRSMNHMVCSDSFTFIN